jgi:acylglycerol lipase
VLSGATLAAETTQPALLVAAAGLFNSISPKLAISPPLPSSVLSRDEAVMRAYDTDPLVEHGNVRVRMGHQIFSTSRYVKTHLSELKLPLLIFHGSDDKLCPPAGSQILYDGAGSSDKTLKFYEGLRHETHNEPEQGMVIENIINWLNAH